MPDVVDKETRSRMMAGIRGKHTQPEMAVRRFLHSKGFRYRLHRKDLPGQPDLVLPRFRLAVFVHGCFWHRHSGCFYSRLPSTRHEFWQQKLDGNARRDERQILLLFQMGWRVLVVWECGLRHSKAQLEGLELLVRSDTRYMEWPSAPPRMADLGKA